MPLKLLAEYLEKLLILMLMVSFDVIHADNIAYGVCVLSNILSLFVRIQKQTGLQCAEKIKYEFDERWSPHWHVIVGRSFGSFVTHETKRFLFFYLEDKAIMIFKAG